MSKHTMEFDISNPRALPGAKIRIWKNEQGVAMVTTVVNDNEVFPFEFDPDKIPDIIRVNNEGDAEALIKEFDELPRSVE